MWRLLRIMLVSVSWVALMGLSLSCDPVSNGGDACAEGEEGEADDLCDPDPCPRNDCSQLDDNNDNNTTTDNDAILGTARVTFVEADGSAAEESCGASLRALKCDTPARDQTRTCDGVLDTGETHWTCGALADTGETHWTCNPLTSTQADTGETHWVCAQDRNAQLRANAPRDLTISSGRVYVLDAGGLAPLDGATGGCSPSVTPAAITRDPKNAGTLLMTDTGGGLHRVTDPTTCATEAICALPQPSGCTGGACDPGPFATNGDDLFVAYPGDASVLRVDLDTCETREELNATADVTGVALEGDALFLGVEDGTIHALDTRTGQLKTHARGAAGELAGLAYDGVYFVVGDVDDRSVKFVYPFFELE